MKYYNFETFVKKIETKESIKFVQVKSNVNVGFSNIYIGVSFKSIYDMVLLKLSNVFDDATKFRTEIIKVNEDRIFIFSNDNEYEDSDIDSIINNIDSFCFDSMTNHRLRLIEESKEADYSDMLKKHIKEFEDSNKYLYAYESFLSDPTITPEQKLNLELVIQKIKKKLN